MTQITLQIASPNSKRYIMSLTFDIIVFSIMGKKKCYFLIQ